jgi:hypothetical protein
MNSLKLHKIAMIFTILAFVSPVISTVIAAAVTGELSKRDSVWPLQIPVMGVYNLVTLVPAIIAYSIGVGQKERESIFRAKISFSICITFCIASFALMTLWWLIG